MTLRTLRRAHKGETEKKYYLLCEKFAYKRKNIYLCSEIDKYRIMLTKDNIQGLSNAEIIRSLGAQYKNYRLRAELTQKEVAEKAGVSLITLRAFENGKAVNITMGNLLALLRVIEQLEGITEILPEIPISPYQLLKLQSKQKKRIRHGK